MPLSKGFEVIMRNKISKNELAHGAFVLLGWILLLSLVSRVWIVFFISLAITLFLVIRSKFKKREENSLQIPVIENTNTEHKENWFTVILKQVNEQVKSVYPDVKWVWKNPNAQKSIEAGEEVLICLNKAGGYKVAKLIICDLTVQGLDFTVNTKQNISEETRVEDEVISSISRGEDSVNYDLLAYEWVQDNILLLNERINDLIGQGETEFLIQSEELPIKESWRNICSELMREGIKDVECVPEGIKFNLKKELSKNE